MENRFFLGLMLLAACAHAPPPPPKAIAIRPPYPSSVAAVLGHRAELALTDAQVAKLEAIDTALAAQNDALRPAAPAAENEAAPAPAPPIENAHPGRGGGGMRGGGGSRGSSGGGGGGGAHHRRAAPEATGVDLAKQDDNDVKAYLEAEAVLTPGQQTLAREIAEHYREALFDWREAMRTHPSP